MPFTRGSRYPLANTYEFTPARLTGLVLWCKYQTGITVTGAGVSQWNDASGLEHHLKQANDTNRPAKQSDGAILFDGVDNFLKADAFTFIQPSFIYVLGKQITWTASDNWFDGDTANTGLLQQVTLTPQIAANADIQSSTISPALNTDVVVCVGFNGANGVLQLNHGTPVTGNFGADTLDGFTLGAIGGGGSGWSNIQIKEVIAYNTAHDANTRRRVIKYLAKVGKLSI